MLNPIINCPTCDRNEQKRHVEGGECRECRGVERPERGRRPGYVSPDRVERAGDAIDQREMEARNRILDGRMPDE